MGGSFIYLSPIHFSWASIQGGREGGRDVISVSSNVNVVNASYLLEEERVSEPDSL